MTAGLFLCLATGAVAGGESYSGNNNSPDLAWLAAGQSPATIGSILITRGDTGGCMHAAYIANKQVYHSQHRASSNTTIGR